VDAEAEYRQALEIDPNNVLVYRPLILVLVKRGAAAEAVELAERAYALFPWFWGSRVQLGALLRQAGQKDRAEKLLRDMDQGDEVSVARASFEFHLVSGEPQQAAPWLVKEAESRSVNAVMLRIVQNLYPGPYWAAVAKKMNLPE
jgi:tetratricopeptide (TPR) repeat protein